MFAVRHAGFEHQEKIEEVKREDAEDAPDIESPKVG
jgi:hypothetical protein